MAGHSKKVGFKKRFRPCFLYFLDKLFVGPSFGLPSPGVIFSSLFFLLPGIRWHMGTELVAKITWPQQGPAPPFRWLWL